MNKNELILSHQEYYAIRDIIKMDIPFDIVLTNSECVVIHYPDKLEFKEIITKLGF